MDPDAANDDWLIEFRGNIESWIEKGKIETATIDLLVYYVSCGCTLGKGSIIY